MGGVQTAYICNDTPFLLDIRASGNEPNCMESHPIKNRIIEFNCGVDYSKIEIFARDANGTIIKSVKFYSYKNYSWLVTDECVRRQAYGSNLFIAMKTVESEKSENLNDYSPDSDVWLWNNCDRIKCYSWIKRYSEMKRYLCDDIDEERIVNFNLCFQSSTKLSYVNFWNNKIHIYNTTPYFLQIEVFEGEDNNLLFLEMNNPQNDRISVITSNIRYPFISIYAMDAAGSTLKHAMFYSYYNYSWVVGDAFIWRQQNGSDLYVADSCTEKESEEYYSSNTNYLWEYCNDIKCYNWKSGSGKELTLYKSTARIEWLKPGRCNSIFSQFFVDASHLTGFSEMSAKEKRKIIDFINNQITADIISRGGSASSNITNNRQNSREYIRLDLQGQDSDQRFNRYSIQIGNRTFATVHIQIGLRIFDDELVRNAFRQSLEHSRDLWLTDQTICREDDKNYIYTTILVAEFILWIRQRRC